MTKTIPNSWSDNNTIDLRALSPGRAGDFSDLADSQNLIWARWRSEWGSHPFDPFWEAQNTGSYGQDSGTASRNLDELNLGGIAEKQVNSGSGIVRVGLRVFIVNLDIQLTITNEETSTQLSQTSFSHGTPTEWILHTVDLTRSDVVDGSGVPQLCSAKIEAQSTTATASDGRWGHVRIGEIEITATGELPDGL